jgi:hypothetical protein
VKIAGLVSIIILSCVHRANAWGFWGHRMINRMACFTLPPELFPFYKSHIDYLTEHAVDPDKRRYSDPLEAPRHFIDVDHYGENPFDTLPARWEEAVARFSMDSLNKYGIVPWHIRALFNRLVRAFSERDVGRIVYYSAHLGHYVADAHVPLHCTENYNGQLTNQKGIHGFWESRLPEMFGKDYDFFVGRAKYITDIQSFAWEVIRASYAALDSVLDFEKALDRVFDPDQKYAFEQRGNQLIRTYSSLYSAAYHNDLGGQVERRIQQAIIATGSIWYTAWVNAGMPVLSDISIAEPGAGLPEEEKVVVDSSRVFMNKRECE